MHTLSNIDSMGFLLPMVPLKCKVALTQVSAKIGN